MNTPVKFEVAKLLKEKRFDKYTYSGYTQKGEVYLHQGGQEPVKNGEGYYEGRQYTGGEFYCSAPTIAEVVMWLYEKHGIWTEASLNQFSTPKNLEWMYSLTFIEDCSYSHSLKHYKSLTEAYEAAIEYTLTKLI